jgi:hypothetical protein
MGSGFDALHFIAARSMEARLRTHNILDCGDKNRRKDKELT